MAKPFLWLDDERPSPTPEGWDVVLDLAQFATYVDEHEVTDLVSLDHDLNDQHYQQLALHGEDAVYEGSGLDCVVYMIENSWLPETVVVHTMNPWGRVNMVNSLEAAGYHSVGYTVVYRACPASPVLRRFDAFA